MLDAMYVQCICNVYARCRRKRVELLQHKDGLRKSGSVFGSRASIWLDAERTKAQQESQKIRGDKRAATNEISHFGAGVPHVLAASDRL